MRTLLPRLLLTLAIAGATLGATASFLVARYLAMDWVRRKAGGRLEQLIAGVEAEGWRFVAFTRLVPLFPFNLLNYALGLPAGKTRPASQTRRPTLRDHPLKGEWKPSRDRHLQAR